MEGRMWRLSTFLDLRFSAQERRPSVRALAVRAQSSGRALACFPKVILSPSDSRMSAAAPLNLEMALFSPASLVFIKPVLVMWSAWQ